MRLRDAVIVVAFVFTVLAAVFLGGVAVGVEAYSCESVTQSRDINLPLLPEVAPMGGGGGNTF